MAPPVPKVGSLFAARYRIQASLGEGGMGVVLGALDERTGIDCAIKLVGADAIKSDTARLVREARALMLLASAHVVRVFDVGEVEGFGPYLVLERLQGSDLACFAPMGRRIPLPVVAAASIQVCDALAQAHAIGIVHRDIKPSNLFLARTPDGREIVKVLDFGVSKLKDAARWDAQPTLTSGDGPLGSPQFISPEQLADARAVDERSDVWSLGVVMFRLLSGAYPFVGNNVAETFSAVLNAPIPRLSEIGVEVPEAFERVLDRCLRRNVDERLALARALAAALEPFAGPASAVGDGLRGDPSTTADSEPPTETTPPDRVAEEAEVVPPRTAGSSPRTIRWLLLGGGCVGVLAIAKIMGGVHARASGPAPSAAPLAPVVSAEVLEVSDVEIDLVAQQPIVAVRAAGLRRLRIDGVNATLSVQPWSGTLAIEAELEGGGHARADAMAGGRGKIQLELGPGRGIAANPPLRAQPQAPRRPPIAAPVPSPKVAKPPPHASGLPGMASAPGAASNPAPELHRNPYL